MKLVTIKKEGLNMSEFNLLEEKWLKVLDGTEVKEVALYDLFENAHNYTALAGELPTQDFAILRFLLAVMYGSFYRNINEPDDAYDLWDNMYKVEKFDIEKIKNYLEPFKSRFYLFDDEFPFYQVPNIKGTKGFARKLNGEISESGTGEKAQKIRIFSMYSGNVKNELNFSDAARWLLHLIGYDDTSGKQNADKKIYGKLDSPGAGWLGQLGGIYAEGKNLFETLMYNFCILNNSGELFELGQAIWEKDKIENGKIPNNERNRINIPKDLLSLLTIQSRRVSLEQKDGKVTGYTFIGGDFFVKRDGEKVISGKNPFIEQMTIWRNNEKSSNNVAVYLPKRHNSAKLMWTSLDFFLLNNEENANILPGILNNIRCLQYAEILQKQKIKICAVGMIYGDKDTSLENVYKDRLVFDSELITEIGIDWANRICEEVKITEDLVREYGKLAGDLFIATGGDKGKKDAQLNKIRDKEKEEAYFMLDIPFRKWFETVSVKDDMDSKTMEWWEISSGIIRKAKDKLISRYNFKICKEHDGKECYSSISKFEYITQSKEVFINRGKKSK
jgi:CRISPR system Cascade subunit CasA